jgi:hypothetical protein
MAEAIAREPLHALPVVNTVLRGIQFWRSITNLGGLFIWSALNWRRFWPVIASWE